MRRIVLAAFSTLAALVVLFSYPTSTGQSGSTAAEPVSSAKVVSGGQRATSATTGQGPDPATTTPAAGNTAIAPDPAVDGSTTQAAAAPETAAGATPVTVDGAQEMTRYGVVQVQVVITDGSITDVNALEFPQTDRKDIQINNRAIPMLRAQVLAAQSANIDGVSGATFTSDGYVSSLQSALDTAGFAQ